MARKKAIAKEETGAADRLVESTIELMRTKTPDDISVNDIAVAAGVSKALLLYHFGSRQAVVLAALDSFLGSMTSRIEAVMERVAASARDGKQPLRTVLSMFSYELSGPEDYAGILVRLFAVGTVDDSVRQRLIRFRTRLVGLFSRAIGSGGADQDATAELLFATALGLELSRMFVDQPKSADAASRLLQSKIDRLLA
jgi:AcrR family transcriptional regulator